MRVVTSKEMQELDRRAIEELGIPSLTLMENAGRGVAEIVMEIAPANSSILILCGKGNNGGDGLVAARYLAERGFGVTVLLFCEPSELKNDPTVNFKKLSELKVLAKILGSDTDYDTLLQNASLVIDALFGVGLKRKIEEPYASAIAVVNRSGKKVVAIDVPSGLDADTGEVLGIAVKASVTATLALAKKGLYAGKGPEYSGAIRIVDIGIPKEILRHA